jgi:xanthine dehydrogenase accessory factor
MTCRARRRPIDGYQLDRLSEGRRFIIVSTQGKGDEAALRAAVTVDAAYHAFVGSHRKMAALRQTLLADGVPAAALDRVKAPAGLDLGAITPEEIALSILAEVIRERHRGQRGEARG